MNILMIVQIIHLASKVSLEIHLSLKPIHLSFMLAHFNLNYSLKSVNFGLKLGHLSHRVCFKFAHLSLLSHLIQSTSQGSNWPFITTWEKNLSWGSYLSTWCLNVLNWSSNVLNEGSNVPAWGSNMPTRSPNRPKFSHFFSLRKKFSHREISLKFSQWD